MLEVEIFNRASLAIPEAEMQPPQSSQKRFSWELGLEPAVTDLHKHHHG